MLGPPGLLEPSAGPPGSAVWSPPYGADRAGPGGAVCSLILPGSCSSLEVQRWDPRPPRLQGWDTARGQRPQGNAAGLAFTFGLCFPLEQASSSVLFLLGVQPLDSLIYTHMYISCICTYIHILFHFVP